MVEKAGYQNVDRILIVDCPTAVQIRRVMERDDLTRAQVEAIMQTQATRDERLRVSDEVIENSGEFEDLEIQVQNLHAKYMAIAELTRREQQ